MKKFTSKECSKLAKRSRLKLAEYGAWLAIITYFLLSIFKLSIGYFGSAHVLTADGLNNFTDTITSIAILIGIKIAQKPPDANHPYGHLRAENIASLLASIIIGVQVFLNALKLFFIPAQTLPSLLTATTSLICSLILFILFHINYVLAKKVKNSSLLAAALDHRNDTLISLCAFLGILATRAGYPFIDYLAAMLVGVLIIFTAITIFWGTTLTLTDAFNPHELLKLKRLILNIDGVLDVTSLKGRTHGNKHYLEIGITVPAHLTMQQAQQIKGQIERAIHCVSTSYKVFIHTEPLQ